MQVYVIHLLPASSRWLYASGDLGCYFYK
jgi:hypothetical protein